MKETLIWNVIEISASLIECILLANYIVNFLDFKSDKYKAIKYLLLLLLTACNNIIISRLVVLDSITGVIQLVIVMLYSFIFMQGNNFKRIFASFTSIFMILIINGITLSVFNTLTSQDIEVLITSNGIFRILILFVTKFAYFITTMFIVKMFRRKDYGFSREEIIYILCIFSITIITGNIMFEYIIRHEDANGMFFNFIFISMIIIDIFSYIFLRIISKNYHKSITDAKDDDLLFSNKIINEIELHNGYVNDIKNLTHEHLKTVSYLIKNKFYNEAEQYIEKVCSNDMTIPVKSIHTSSKLINLIINTKLYICYINNILVNFNITGSVDIFSEKDICTILAVVFDETTNLCLSCPEPVFIDLQISDNNGYLSIIVTLKANEILNHAEEYMDNISSDVINAIIKKYNGAVTFDKSPENIIVNLWLSIKKAESYRKKTLLTSVER